MNYLNLKFRQMKQKLRDVIYCSNSNKHYWDEAGIIRIFEKVLDHNITYEKAKAKYPNIVKVF